MTDANPSHSATGRRLRVLGAILWPSFITAAAATGLFFANIDPESLRAQTLPEWSISREAGYTIGFFMFWITGAVASTLGIFLYGAPAPRRSALHDPESQAE